MTGGWMSLYHSVFWGHLLTIQSMSDRLMPLMKLFHTKWNWDLFRNLSRHKASRCQSYPASTPSLPVSWSKRMAAPIKVIFLRTSTIKMANILPCQEHLSHRNSHQYLLVTLSPLSSCSQQHLSRCLNTQRVLCLLLNLKITQHHFKCSDYFKVNNISYCFCWHCYCA